METFDEGDVKDNRHTADLVKNNAANVCTDKAPMGPGCVNSWGGMPLDQYRLLYGDHEFTFIMDPVSARRNDILIFQ